ncbi:MAG: penicillin-binding protein 2 [Candidatus Yonathbacteria bacterium]|nr:penicillin-binding protein 2 [Candidatus Yonathbacteria bacterium]
MGKFRNMWVLNGGILFITILLIVKLGYIQIALGEMYQDKVEQQYASPLNSIFNRGSIFFEEKIGRKISAATVTTEYALAIDPSQIVDSEKLADRLLALISFDRKDFIDKASQKNSRYKEILKSLEEKDALAIKALKEKGIIIEKNKKRFYPGGQTAAQVIGFVGSDGDTISGRYGLERYYNDILTRKYSDTFSSFFADFFLKAGKTLFSDRSSEGDIVTTIEPTVQGMFERTLTDDVLKKYNAVWASGIIMDPKTGEIYAMGSVPSFDPNNFSKEKNQSVFTDLLVEGVYEMGSIIKPLVMAAGLDHGVVTAATTYDDKGFVIIDNKRVENFDKKARGVVSMQEALSQSLNTGLIFVMQRLGKDVFREYFKAYGLGEETGIDLPNEGLGKIGNLESPRDIEYATASFGQGIALTPIATIRALASLANGGNLVTPHVVKRIENGLGVSQDFIPGSERRVIKKETSREISRMLTYSVDNVLLNGTLKQEHYSVAVKTGTAQQVEGGKYSETDSLHTFIGYFPSYDPKFIIFLAVKNPRGAQYSSNTLSSPFMQITKFLINYYDIPPDR